MPFDNTCKYLSEKAPDRFAGWVLGTVPPAIELLRTELSIEPIRTDFLASLPTLMRLLHLEFQVKADTDPPLPLRMLDYFTRLYCQYRQPITQFLILLKYSKAAAEIPSEFELEGTRHRYNIIRMWEQDPEIFLQDTALLPLAVLCAAEDTTALLSRVASEVAKIEEQGQREEISNSTQILAGLRFKKNLIRQLFTGGIMRESVIYQEILEEGMQAEAVALVLRQLTRRIGTVEPEVQEQIRELSTAQLEDLGEALLDFSEAANLTAWLESRQG